MTHQDRKKEQEVPVIVLRVAGILLAAIGVAFLDTGLGLDFSNLGSHQKIAFVLMGAGLGAAILSALIPRGSMDE